MLKKTLSLILILFFLPLIGPKCQNKAHTVKVRFDHIKGLQNGDPVLYEGTSIGEVTDIILSKEGKFLVNISIQKSFIHAVTKFSKFYITADPQNETLKALTVELAQQGGEILPAGAIVDGSAREVPSLANNIENKIKEGLGYLQQQVGEIIGEINEFSSDLQQLPKSAEVERLKEKMDRLAEEMTRAGKAAKEKIKNEYLPRLQAELNELKEKLHQFGREDEIEPLEIRLKGLREI